MAARRESLTVADTYRTNVRTIAEASARHVRALWLALAGELATSEPARGTFTSVAAALVTAGQTSAVRAADRYIADYLTSERRITVAPVGVDPGAYVGAHLTTAPLESVFAVPLTVAAQLRRRGYPDTDAITGGARKAITITRNEITAAGRDTVADLIRNHKTRGRSTFSGWHRGVSAGSCPACTSLAVADILSWNTPMVTHPSCTCVQVPTVADLPGAEQVTPPTGRELFDLLSTAEQDRIYGATRAANVRAGAPLDFAHQDHGHTVPTPQGDHP